MIAHAGAGALISRGLMDLVPYQVVEDTLTGRGWYASGGMEGLRLDRPVAYGLLLQMLLII